VKLILPAGHPARHFAVLDEDSQSATMWHLDRRGQLVAWPRGARNGPILWQAPGAGREHVIPADLSGGDRSAWIEHWATTVSPPWHQTIRETITADPDRAAALFSFTVVNCCKCGRFLEDPESRAAGIGPKCAPMVPAVIREAIRREVGRLIAERAREDDEAAFLTGERILEVVVAR
jgi:hypothetical protein